jgi:hypothetical protein
MPQHLVVSASHFGLHAGGGLGIDLERVIDRRQRIFGELGVEGRSDHLRDLSGSGHRHGPLWILLMIKGGEIVRIFTKRASCLVFEIFFSG